MKTFIYKLKDETGKTLHGFLEATDKEDLRRKLRQSRFYYIDAYAYDRKKIFKKTITLEALIMFTNRLSSLIGSGIPILTAMHILWRQTEDKTVQLIISHINQNLEHGKKISEGLNDFKNVFPPIYRAMITVAEKAGGLVTILDRLSEYLQYQRTMITKTKKATLYPSIVLTFAFLVLICMFMFVVPTFEKILTKLKVELPFITQLIISISQTIKSWPFIISTITGVIILFLLYKIFKKHPKFAYWLDSIKIKIPFIGPILYTISLSRFAHSLSMLIGSGIPILDSFEAAKTTPGNERIVASINDVQKKVEEGSPLYEAFRDNKLFPIMLIEMIGIGESSGTIVNVLKNLAIYFDEESDYNQNKFFTIIEPFLIILVGGIVIIALLAIYMPIFSIWQNLIQY